MTYLSIRSIGNSSGVVLPKDILAKLRCSIGDRLHVIETPNGIELTPYDPLFAKDMDTVEDIISRNKNMLKKLAE